MWFVNRRWTASILITWPTKCGDQTHDAYSSNGLTCVINARINVDGSLEVKHLCVRLASLWARDTVWLICMSNHTPLSIKSDTVYLRQFVVNRFPLAFIFCSSDQCHRTIKTTCSNSQNCKPLSVIQHSTRHHVRRQVLDLSRAGEAAPPVDSSWRPPPPKLVTCVSHVHRSPRELDWLQLAS